MLRTPFNKQGCSQGHGAQCCLPSRHVTTLYPPMSHARRLQKPSTSRGHQSLGVTLSPFANAPVQRHTAEDLTASSIIFKRKMVQWWSGVGFFGTALARASVWRHVPMLWNAGQTVAFALMC